MVVPEGAGEEPGKGAPAALRSRIAGQTAGYIGSNAIGSALSAVVTALLASHMTTDVFGSYLFAVSSLVFVANFFEFGLFLPGARMSAQADPVQRRRIVGATLLAFVPVGLAFSLCAFALSFGVNVWFHVDAGSAIRAVAPLAFVYPFSVVSVQLAQGMGQLHAYSVSTAAGKVALATGVLFVVYAGGSTIGATSALALHVCSILVSAAILVVWLRPRFRGASRVIRPLLAGVRHYGFQVYVGRVLGISTYNMDVLMVGAFTNASQVGFYALAGMIATLISLPATGMSAALFPGMAKAVSMGRWWVRTSWMVGLMTWLGAVMLAKPVIGIILPQYLPSYPLLVVLGLGAIVRGVTSVYNSFLAAHARGRELRNAALVLALSNLVLNFALIPPFGAMGAAWASFIALLANFFAHVVSYRHVRIQENAEGATQAI